MRRPSGSASTERTVPVRTTAWVGSTRPGGTRTVANCADVKPIAAAASAMTAAREMSWRLSSTAPHEAGIATDSPIQSGGSVRSAK